MTKHLTAEMFPTPGEGQKLLLMTDLDGTLLELAPKPDAVFVSTDLLQLLADLVKQKDILGPVIISGRTLADLNRLLPVPGLLFAGQHGSRIQEAGGNIKWLVDYVKLTRPLQNFKKLLLKITSGKKGFLIEDKQAVIAFHYRLALQNRAVEVIKQVEELANSFAKKYPLELVKGNKVLELRPKGLNKSLAINYFCDLYPDFLPIYLGDDTTDEDAFRALPSHGMGILVAQHNRPTAANYYISGIPEVYTLLEHLLDQK